MRAILSFVRVPAGCYHRGGVGSVEGKGMRAPDNVSESGTQWVSHLMGLRVVASQEPEIGSQNWCSSSVCILFFGSRRGFPFL